MMTMARWILLLLVTVALAACDAGALPSMELAFSLNAPGAGAAAVWTYQQPSPTGVPPYALQDEWVLHVYPSGAGAVFTVLLASSEAQQQLPACTLLPGQPGQCPGSLAHAIKPHKTQWLGGLLPWPFKHQQQQEDSSPWDLHVDDVTGAHVSAAAPGSITPAAADDADALKSAGSNHKGQSARAPAAACTHRNFQLYLGMSIPLEAGAGQVSQQQLDHFLATEVSSRVQGFTVFRATGFWEGQQEATAVLEVLSARADILDAVTSIAEAYKTAFKQEAVLIKETACPARVDFV